MTKAEVIEFKRESEDSKPEKGLRITIDQFDAIEVILDENGLEVEQMWDVVNVINEVDINYFP